MLTLKVSLSGPQASQTRIVLQGLFRHNSGPKAVRGSAVYGWPEGGVGTVWGGLVLSALHPVRSPCGGLGRTRTVVHVLVPPCPPFVSRPLRSFPLVSILCLVSSLFFPFPIFVFAVNRVPPRGAVALSVAAALRPLPSRRARLPPVRSRCASSRRPRPRSASCFTAARHVSWYRCLALILAGSPGTSTCPSTSGHSGRAAATRVRPPPSTARPPSPPTPPLLVSRCLADMPPVQLPAGCSLTLSARAYDVA